MKALSNKQGIIAAAAMDQRGSLQKSIAAAKGVPAEQVTAEMMSEFKVAVSKVLTPHASAILLDPEYGLPAAKARSSNAGLLLAYEESGYDNTKPGRLPDLLPHVSAKRIVDWGANAVKILIYYSPFDDPQVNDIKHAFIERIGAECEAIEIPFFLEFVGYDPKGGDEKGLEFAKLKPQGGDRKHGGVLQAAVQGGRAEGGSAHQRELCGGQQRVQGPEGVFARAKRWIFSARPRAWPRSRSSI